MRIKITAGGIYGQPTKENPTGELPIGTELKVEKAPLGWAGRYIDLDADAPTDGEDVEALKARIAELEGQVKDQDEQIAKLKPADAPTGAYTVTDKSPGWFVVTQGDKEITKSLRADDVKGFDALSDDDKAKFVTENAKAE